MRLGLGGLGRRRLFRLMSSVYAVVISLAACSASAADMRRIVVLESMTVPAVQAHTAYFSDALRNLLHDGPDDVVIEVLNAQGDWARAETLLATALAAGRPDLVVGNATLAAKTAYRLLRQTDIPLLFMTVTDPVGAGLIPEIGRPGGRNVTGKVHMIERETKINLVMRLVSDAIDHRPIRIGFIHSTYPSAVGDIRALHAAAEKRDDIVFLPYSVPYRKAGEAMSAMMGDVRKGIDVLESQVDFWWEPSGPLGESDIYTQTLLTRSKKPIVMGLKTKSVQMGALVHLSPNAEATGRGTALLADAVLKGTVPGQLPATVPDRFDLGLNLTTALACGVVVPPDLLELAGKNVFR